MAKKPTAGASNATETESEDIKNVDGAKDTGTDTGTAPVASSTSDTKNTPQSEPDTGAGNSASPVEASSIATDLGQDHGSSIIIFDLSAEPTVVDAANLQRVMKYLEAHVNAFEPVALPDVSAWSDLTQEQFQAAYPKTYDLINGAAGKELLADRPILRVTSAKDGFRRGGFSHPRAPTDHDIATLTPAQVESFLSETTLVVEIV